MRPVRSQMPPRQGKRGVARADHARRSYLCMQRLFDRFFGLSPKLLLQRGPKWCNVSVHGRPCSVPSVRRMWNLHRAPFPFGASQSSSTTAGIAALATALPAAVATAAFATAAFAAAAFAAAAHAASVQAACNDHSTRRSHAVCVPQLDGDRPCCRQPARAYER